MQSNKVVVRSLEVVHCDWPGAFCPLTGRCFHGEEVEVYEVLSVEGYPFIAYPRDIVFIDGVLAKLSEQSFLELYVHLTQAILIALNQKTLTKYQLDYLQEKAFCEVAIEEPCSPTRLF